MSNTNQSNGAAAQGNSQEIPPHQTGLSTGSTNPITNSIRNGTVQQMQTATVFLASGQGGASTVTPLSIMNALSQQHTIFKPIYAAGIDAVTILVRKIDIWADGNNLLTAKFHMGGRSKAQVVETKQFYAIGFAGAERNHISFDYDMVPHVLPWDLKDRSDDEIVEIAVVDSGGVPAAGGYFAQVTFSFYNRSFLSFLQNPGLINMPNKEAGRKRAAEREAEMQVAKIKKLTIPVNAE